MSARKCAEIFSREEVSVGDGKALPFTGSRIPPCKEHGNGRIKKT
jgi:hypothetical protein